MGAFIIVFGVGTFDSGEAFSSDALQLAKKRSCSACAESLVLVVVLGCTIVHTIPSHQS